eukprot:Nitzschia sp. Nitz4//scaffold199_size41809//12125//13750//NITZ4_007448-RA/size41809-processed-gene-0.50-mRNA-1//1//CDS//3329540555//693//frame0
MYPQITTESHLGSTINGSSSSNKDNGIAAATKCLCTLVREETEDALDVSSHVPRCPACVYRALKPHLDRHAQAVADHALARQECARVIQSSTSKPGVSNPQPLGELQEQSRQLRERLSCLRQQCADMAVRVASQAVENDTQREHIQDLQLQPPSHALEEASTMVPQVQLERLEQSVLDGSLRQAIQLTSLQVRVLRFQWARKAFAMHRLDIDHSDTQFTHHQQQRMRRPNADAAMPRRARGIGKIGGLPLPHAGPELYGVLPPTELQSALRLVASVTSSVARCLGIVLPHPILMTPAEQPNADITDTVSDQALLHRIRENHHAVSLDDEPATSNISHTTHGNFHSGPNPTGGGVLPSITSSAYWTSQPMRFGTSSTSSILSLMDTSYWKRSAQKALARATGHPSGSSGMGSAESHPSGHPQYPSHTQQQYTANVARTLSTTPTPFIPPSMDAQQLAMRIQYATAAVLAEDDRPGSSQFALTTTTPQSSQDFAIALQLLQNDVVALCIRTGVNVDTLWPAEAVLLNLYQLDQYCREQTAVPY